MSRHCRIRCLLSLLRIGPMAGRVLSGCLSIKSLASVWSVWGTEVSPMRYTAFSHINVVLGKLFKRYPAGCILAVKHSRLLSRFSTVSQEGHSKKKA